MSFSTCLHSKEMNLIVFFEGMEKTNSITPAPYASHGIVWQTVFFL